MERTFTTSTAGPTSLRLPAGAAHAVVDPAVKTTTIRLHTDDTEGPAVDAIRRAVGATTAGLSVTVPDLGVGAHSIVHTSRGGVSSVSFSGGSSVVMVGGRVIVNGRVVTGDSDTGVISSGITADITLPPGTGFVFTSVSADLDVSGPIAELAVHTTFGDVEVGVVGILRANTTSGDIQTTAVTDQIDVTTVSGDIEVGTYRGQRASLRTVSGDIALAATPAAIGDLSAVTVSGDIRLRGAAHLNPRTSTVSGRVRT